MIPGNIKIHELQKITLLGTSYILLERHSPSNRLLTLGPRSGLGYCVVLWNFIEEDNNWELKQKYQGYEVKQYLS